METENKGRNIVLGSDGFVGGYLVNFLRSQGKGVIGYDIKRGIAQDCRSSFLCLNREDIVYFLAWEVGGAKYLFRRDTQMEQIQSNLALMKNVFDQLDRSKSKFIFISSQLAGTDTTYGTLKRLGELWTEQLGGCCIRLWNAYGAYEDCSIRSHVISDFIHQALGQHKIMTITTGEEERQFIHLEDICKAIQTVLDACDRTVYDVTSYEWVTIADIAKIIAFHLNVDVVFGTEKGTTQKVTMKNRSIQLLPSVSLEVGILDTIELYKRMRGK